LRPPTRSQRWRAAVAELIALQAEYAAWLDALPEPLRDTATGEVLLAIVDLDLDELLPSSRRAASGAIEAAVRTSTAARPRGASRFTRVTPPPEGVNSSCRQGVNSGCR
jgi:hypothetical protein